MTDKSLLERSGHKTIAELFDLLKEKDAENKQLKQKIESIGLLVQSLRSEYNLWGSCHQIERQIELLEEEMK